VEPGAPGRLRVAVLLVVDLLLPAHRSHLFASSHSIPISTHAPSGAVLGDEELELDAVGVAEYDDWTVDDLAAVRARHRL
jgi:hypothetical protein